MLELLHEAEEQRQQCFLMGVVPERSDQRNTPIKQERPIAYEINYAFRALNNACEELRSCPADSHRRNHLLNALSFKMGRLIVRGWIGRKRVEEYLWRACRANGLLEDPEDGPARTRRTMVSGIEAGMLKPYRDIRWQVEQG
jgi:hypothetical protein